jgi:hypothetical protein
MTAAKFLIADRAKRNEEFVQLGAGDESGGMRMTLGHLGIEEMLFRYLDTVGDGSGTKTATGNYSSTPTNFLIKPPASGGLTFAIHSLIIQIEDGAVFDSGTYGNLAALTNGIQLYVANVSGVSVMDLLDGAPIKTNGQWERVAFEARLNPYSAVPGNLMNIRWDFTQTSSPLAIPPGWSFVARMSDDLSGLTGHSFFVMGHRHAHDG